MRNVEIEFVSYRTDEVAHVADVLVANYVRYSQIARIEAWDLFGRILQERIRTHSPHGFKLTAPGIDLWFSGFDLSSHEEAGKVTFEEPWFGAFANRQFVLPSERTHIERVTSAIFEEMSKVYHMDNTNPGAIRFPKEVYAQNQTVKVPLGPDWSLSEWLADSNS